MVDGRGRLGKVISKFEEENSRNVFVPRLSDAQFCYSSPLEKNEVGAKKRGLKTPSFTQGYKGVIGIYAEALTQVLFGGWSPGMRSHLKRNGDNYTIRAYSSFPDHVNCHPRYPCFGEVKAAQKRWARFCFPDEQMDRYMLAFLDPIEERANVKFFFYLHDVEDVADSGGEINLMKNLAEGTCLLVVLPFTLAYSIYDYGKRKGDSKIISRFSQRVNAARGDVPMQLTRINSRGISMLLSDSEEFVKELGEKVEDYNFINSVLADGTHFSLKGFRRESKKAKMTLKINSFPILQIKDKVERRKRFRDEHWSTAVTWLEHEIESNERYLTEDRKDLSRLISGASSDEFDVLPGDEIPTRTEYEKRIRGYEEKLELMRSKVGSRVDSTSGDNLPF